MAKPMSSDRYEERVREAIADLDILLEKHDWEQAAAEAVMIQQKFPASKQVRNLQNRVKGAWRHQKDRLEEQFFEAAGGDDPAAALALFRQLDNYLTPADASRFETTTREVIAKLKANLTMSFKMAVGERDWVAATEVAEQIIRQFPNSQMAGEASKKIEVLRERSLEQRHNEIEERDKAAKEGKQ